MLTRQGWRAGRPRPARPARQRVAGARPQHRPGLPERSRRRPEPAGGDPVSRLRGGLSAALAIGVRRGRHHLGGDVRVARVHRGVVALPRPAARARRRGRRVRRRRPLGPRSPLRWWCSCRSCCPAPSPASCSAARRSRSARPGSGCRRPSADAADVAQRYAAPVPAHVEVGGLPAADRRRPGLPAPGRRPGLHAAPGAAGRPAAADDLQRAGEHARGRRVLVGLRADRRRLPADALPPGQRPAGPLGPPPRQRRGLRPGRVLGPHRRGARHRRDHRRRVDRAGGRACRSSSRPSAWRSSPAAAAAAATTSGSRTRWPTCAATCSAATTSR